VSTGLLTVAETLHARGVAEQNTGHPQRALRLLERAWQAVESVGAAADPEALERLSAAIWISLALNEAEVHGVERGLLSL